MLPAKTEEEEAASTGTHPWMAHGRNAGSEEQQNGERKKRTLGKCFFYRKSSVPAEAERFFVSSNEPQQKIQEGRLV